MDPKRNPFRTCESDFGFGDWSGDDGSAICSFIGIGSNLSCLISQLPGLLFEPLLALSLVEFWFEMDFCASRIWHSAGMAHSITGRRVLQPDQTFSSAQQSQEAHKIIP